MRHRASDVLTFRVEDSSALPGECDSSMTLDYSVKQNEDNPMMIDITWEEGTTKGAVVDIFDNGVYMKTVDTNEGSGASIKIFRLEDEAEHSITIREYCRHKLRVSQTKNVNVFLPCHSTGFCPLFMFGGSELPDGYVTVSSSNEPQITYFAGVPEIVSRFKSESSFLHFPVCSGGFAVKLLLPFGKEPDPSSFVLAVHNNTEELIPLGYDGGAVTQWNIVDDIVVMNESFVSMEDTKEFNFVCSSCEFNFENLDFSLLLGDNKTEILRFSGVETEYMYVTVNDRVTQKVYADDDKTADILFDQPLGEYCFTYGRCNKTTSPDRHCLKSLYCEFNISDIVSVTFPVYEPEEKLVFVVNISDKYDLNNPLLRLTSILVDLNSKDGLLNYTPSEFQHGAYTVEINDTALLKAAAGKSATVYVLSLTDCEGQFGAMSNASFPYFLEEKDYTVVIVCCIIAGLIAVGGIVALVLWLIFRTRGESKEAEIEMEFPEDFGNEGEECYSAKNSHSVKSEESEEESEEEGDGSQDSSKSDHSKSSNESGKSDDASSKHDASSKSDKSEASSKSSKSAKSSSNAKSASEKESSNDDDSVSISSASDN